MLGLPFYDNFTRKMRKAFNLDKSGDELNAVKSSKNVEAEEAAPIAMPEDFSLGSSPDPAPFRMSLRAAQLLEGEVATGHDVLDIIFGMVDARRTKRKVAEALGISDGFLNDVLLGRRPISAKLADALGYEKVTVYRKK